LLAPAGVSREIIEKLNSETVRLLGLPDVKERLMNQGADPVPSTPAQFGAYIKAEIVKWASIVRETGAKLE
jgi:tripartite-type tricarboxylate transporter receptor subunit TctC